MNKRIPLIVFYLVYLLVPLASLGVSITMAHGEIARWLYWMVLLPMFCVWGWQLFTTIFPTDPLKQIISFVPAALIISYNALTSPGALLDKFLLDGSILFIALAIILILGLGILGFIMNRHDSLKTKIGATIVFLSLAAPVGYFLYFAYTQGIAHMTAPYRHLILIGQVAAALSVYVPGIVKAFKQGKL